MIDWTPTPEQVNTVLGVLYEVQDALRRLWFALGLSDSVAGQPVWPWAQRLHGELMGFEPGQARRLLLCAAALAIALPLMGLAVFWRRARWPGLLAAVALLAAAPWSVFGLLAGPALPSSFHVSDSGFSARSIVRGQAVYQQHCQRCHAAGGGGEGPDAPALPMWPPRLNGRLLWQRLEGELWWRVRHGLQDRDGQTTMPGFADALSEADTWNVLDFLQAQASGQTLAREGRWELPVRLPDARVRCGVTSELRSLRGLQGQRLLVAASPGTPLVLDPRVLGIGQGSGGAEAGTDCRLVEADAADFRQALALVLGQPADRLQGQQVLVDRQGWLRGRAQPGQSWSAADLVCRSVNATAPVASTDRSAPADADPLGALVAAMDADPVAPRRGGIPH
ncbi:c-type cytochrome [Curvibacter lanceolatus]|uniref:c-type cytochrome n=1 Tax=Curvibacter lanceolatus TaxID=86182 RepID=UPI00037C5CF9|nr:cytochrome c [Curvibacter lanceolatus]